MRRKLFILLVLLIPVLLSAQDFSGLRLMINPGHGGHDSDDRFIPMTGFWESESNLTKALYLRDILSDLCDTVVLSRTQNLTGDDLPLSQISAIANANNVDFFLSIHSNANNQRSNYPLVLFRGYDQEPVFERAREMAQIMAEKMFSFNEGTWTANEPEVRGDWSFYPDWGTSGLGVLRNLSMPGVLTEGSHHDYLMECWRLQNISYRKKEAWCMAWSFRDYFNNPPTSMEIGLFPQGLVAGTLRDQERSTPYYADSTTLDRFLPLNKIQVHMEPGNRVFEGDSMNNGFFFFDSVPPGNYTLFFEADAYFYDSAMVEVQANKLSLVNRFMQFDTTVVPRVLSYSPGNSVEDSISSMQPVEIVFSHPMDTASVASAFSIQPPVIGVLKWNDGFTHMQFIPGKPYEKATGYYWMLDSTATHIWQVPVEAGVEGGFITRNRNRLQVVDHYPRSSQQDVNPGVQFRVVVDAPFNQASLINQVELRDAAGNLLPVRNQKITSQGSRGYYSCDPAVSLEENVQYTFRLQGAVADVDGNILYEPFAVTFSVQEQALSAGLLLDGFETASWSDPDLSPNTLSTDPAKTYFLPYNKYVIQGTKSGRLEYAFTAKEGVCHLPSLAPVQIQENTDTLGCWVFGDLSYNELACWFGTGTGSSRQVIDTMDFAGWRFLRVPLSGAMTITAFELKLLENGLPAGTIYFDELVAMKTTSLHPGNSPILPVLSVFPNPLTSESLIRILIPDNTSGLLELIDYQGRSCWTGKLESGVKREYIRDLRDIPRLPEGILLLKLTLNSRDAIYETVIMLMN
jgi:N-acetylmuramoyl-L-alanine amidase